MKRQQARRSRQRAQAGESPNRYVEKIAQALLQPGGSRLSGRGLAQTLGMCRKTLARYLDAAQTLAERWRLCPVDDADLTEIDRALVAQAKTGRVDAARLVFWRVGMLNRGADITVPPPSEEELEAALALVRGKGAP